MDLVKKLLACVPMCNLENKNFRQFGNPKGGAPGVGVNTDKPHVGIRAISKLVESRQCHRLSIRYV